MLLLQLLCGKRRGRALDSVDANWVRRFLARFAVLLGANYDTYPQGTLGESNDEG